MNRYLFDTNSISLAFNGAIPEKWSRFWREIRMGNRGLLLFEPLVSEIYYKNILEYGKKPCKDKILKCKQIRITKVRLNNRG